MVTIIGILLTLCIQLVMLGCVFYVFFVLLAVLLRWLAGALVRVARINPFSNDS